MPDIVVIGGGLTGLACALEAQRSGADVTLLDAGDEPGGNLRTAIVDDAAGRWRLDLGPNSFGDGSADLMSLVRAVGLEGDLLPAGETAGKTRYLFRDGRVQPVPASPPSFLTSSILPLGARLRLMTEPFRRASRADAPEETLAQFCDRRLGRMARLKLLTPVVSGIYAGDPEQLGAESAFPAMIALEREHGSLVRAAIKGSGPPQRGRLQTFTDGLQALPRAIAATLTDAYRGGCRATRLERIGDSGDTRWRIHTDDGRPPLDTQHVVLATPAGVIARLVQEHAPAIADELAAIEYAPMNVVHVGVRNEDAGALPEAFGFLVPRDEGLRILGALFSSVLFTGRAPDGHSLVTIFTGGALDPDAATLADADILDYVLADLRTALGGSWKPALTRVTRWPRAIPQYVVGHKDRLTRIETAMQGLPGVTLLGNWRGGIAMPNCAREGADAARKIAQIAAV